MKKFYFILLAILEPWVEYRSHLLGFGSCFCIQDNPYLPCSVAMKFQPPKHNSLSMHINMHYTPSTTYSIAFQQPSYAHNKHKAQPTSWQNGTRCSDAVQVLWCHFNLEGSIPTCISFRSENFFCDFLNVSSKYAATVQEVHSHKHAC